MEPPTSSPGDPGIEHASERLVVRVAGWCVARKRILLPLALVFFCIPIWNSLGDHGFNGRSDARYASVAQDMASSGDWIVPRYMGRVHLTKPPMVYWLEGLSIKAIGHSYLAVRLPSALAGTLSLLVLFFFARKVASERVAFFATGLYAIMPLTIFPARMSVTDSLVNLMWMGIIFSGYLKKRFPEQRRWGVVLWIAAALGMLTKGPVLFIPIGLVGVWWIISGSKRNLGRVGLYFGCLALAMVPALGWAIAVGLSSPEAVDIWIHETFDRAVGSGDHAKPIWFFVPVLFAGCFPASAMLILPGLNLRFKQGLGNLRSGNLVGYLGWTIIVPFVIFSLISGKLTSYIMPICAPMALLSALMLERWFDEQVPDPGAGRKMPEVRRGLFVGTLLFIVGFGGGAWYVFGPSSSIWLFGIVLAAIAGGWMARNWKYRHLRAIGLTGFIFAWIIGWVGLEGLEDVALAQMSFLPTAQETFGDAGWSGRMGTYQLEDGMIYWDRDGELEHFDSPQAVLDALQANPSAPLLIVSEADRWDALKETNPDFYTLGQIKAQWHQLPIADARYLIVFDAQD